jgi:hypothetical protein
MANSSRPDGIAENLCARLDQVFADHFARNTPYFGGGGPGYYGVRLENIVPDGSELDLVLTFRAGERYCCCELGCHCDLWSARYWSELRHGMDAHGLGGLPLPTIRTVWVVVEEGATFDPGGLRFPPLRSKGSVYEDGPFTPVVATEEESPPGRNDA